MEESTLDAFAEASGVEDSSSRDEESSNGTGDEDPPSVRVTYRFSTEPRECVRCGESGREHWAGDGGFVCPACVEW
ncbi:DUF7573 domain-containing protein [Natronorarus salvus]|uniref:DUF7573 domain-containing protein n=1 Tax=Natronorarus salvus TaxID=3117733 RepID=UPI002F269B5B